MKNLYFFITSFVLLFSAGSFSQDKISKWRIQIAEKESEMNNINSELENTMQKYQQILQEYDNAQKDKLDKKAIYDKTKNAYDRGSKNVDIISSENLVQLLKEYQAADNDYKNSQEKEKLLENEKNNLQKKVERLKQNKVSKEIEILEVRAKMLDEEMSKPIWSEGNGESILDENKTINECKRLALEYAKRDAMDKGGKTIVESVTKVEDFVLIKDEIKSKAKVQIVEQDLSGDYGKAIRVMHGDMIKYTAKVRLKLKSVDTYNPYLIKINNLLSFKSQKKEILPQFFEDNFNDNTINKYWTIIQGYNNVDITENGQNVIFSGIKKQLCYSGYFLNTISPRSFWISIDVKVGLNNKTNAHLLVDNGYDDQRHRSFSIMFEQLTTEGFWSAGVIDRSLPADKQYRYPKLSNIQNRFSDEHYKYHTIRIEFDYINKKFSGYVDDILLGSEIIDWNLAKGLRISFTIFKDQRGNGITNIMFDNFKSNIPLNIF